MKIFYSLFFLVFVLALQACAPFAPDVRTPYDALPQDYLDGIGDASGKTSANTPEKVLVDTHWWTSFGNTELDSFVNMAVGESFDVLTARARLTQLEATARKSGAALWPSLTGRAGADHIRSSVQNDASTSRLEGTSENFALGVSVSYELDLWGRVYSLREADVLRVLAGQDNVRTAAMTVAALTSDTWLLLVAKAAEIRLVESQIETNKVVLRSLLLRFQNALSTGLDVLQQQETLAASLAEMPLLEAQDNQLRTQFAILLGKAPGTEPAVLSLNLPLLPPAPATGLPIELLEQRPDVRSAWYTLMAAEWAVSAGQADRLPKITLVADAQYAGESALLFSNWLANLSAGLTAPLFEGGRRVAEVERLQGIVEEQVQAYGKVVATAVGEVRDALVNEARQEEYLVRLQDQFRYATLARDEAREGYLNGRGDFLSFIVEHKNAQNLERLVLTQRVELLRFRIALHRALGGDILSDPVLKSVEDI